VVVNIGGRSSERIVQCAVADGKNPAKQVLRRRLIQYLPHPEERGRHRIHHFEKDPEYFFPRLPMDAILVTSADSQLAAIARIKRLSRVAEKVSVRLVEALFHEIRAEARRLAATRPAVAGCRRPI